METLAEREVLEIPALRKAELPPAEIFAHFAVR
jgi:hypothetical protein